MFREHGGSADKHVNADSGKEKHGTGGLKKGD